MFGKAHQRVEAALALEPGDGLDLDPLTEGAQVLTDLDAVGNTTKAITKGIAIATAVLAATALFGSYNDQVVSTLAETLKGAATTADAALVARAQKLFAQPPPSRHAAGMWRARAMAATSNSASSGSMTAR